MKRFCGSTTIFAIALFGLLVFPQPAFAAAPTGGEAPGPAKTDAPSGCPCECDCDACGKMGGAGHMHGAHGAHPMMEGMKPHMEEVRKRVAALRDHEKKLEGIVDPAEFRKAAIEHFRMLDDLQEAHVKHMESMMEKRHEHMQGGHGHPPQ